MSFELDLLLHGATVHTMDPERPRAERVGVWNGWVVGVDEQVTGLTAARTVDLRGNTLLPGFHDAHVHTTSYGVLDAQLDLSGVSSTDDVLSLVAQHADGLAPGAWVVGSGYVDRADPARHPTRDELDCAGGGRPVWLTHRSGHMCAVSSAVLAALPEPLPEDAARYVQRGADGEPTGLLEEAAMELVKAVVGPGSVDQMVDAIDVATSQCVREGTTSITEAGIGCPGVDHSPLEIAAWQHAARAGRAHTRANLMVHDGVFHDLAHHPADRARFGLDLGVHTGFGDDRVRVSAMKIWLDGAGSSGGAATDEDDSGLVEEPGLLHRHVVEAHRAGWQVAAHAMGDRAVDLFLDALESAGPVAEVRARRHRVEHGGLVRPDQLPRLRHLGVVVVIQPAFISEFGDALAHHFGADRLDWSIRHASLLAAGVVVAASSDRPVAPGAPLVGVQAAVERSTASGAAYGADDRVAVEEALAAWTRHAAYAARVEDRVGTITACRLADLVVLGADPLAVATDELAGIEVLATIVGGQVVHAQDGAPLSRP